MEVDHAQDTAAGTRKGTRKGMGTGTGGYDCAGTGGGAATGGEMGEGGDRDLPTPVRPLTLAVHGAVAERCESLHDATLCAWRVAAAAMQCRADQVVVFSSQGSNETNDSNTRQADVAASDDASAASKPPPPPPPPGQGAPFLARLLQYLEVEHARQPPSTRHRHAIDTHPNPRFLSYNEQMSSYSAT